MQDHSSTSAEPATSTAGRPPKCDRETIELLCALIRTEGLSDSAAAERASIPRSTLSEWKAAQPDLVILLRQARAEFRSTQLHIIMDAAQTKNGWRAAAWLLERLFPEDYSPRAKERAAFQAMAAESRSEDDLLLAATAESKAPARQPAAKPAPTNNTTPVTLPGSVLQNVAKPTRAPAGTRPAPLASSIADLTVAV